jgi:branched-chain amino acid transport system permease protein
VNGARLRSPGASLVSLLAPLGLIGLTVALGASGSASFEASLSLILCNLIIVCGLQVFIGNSGVYSFGQIAFTAVGAYLGALLTLPAAFAALQTPALPGLIAEAHPAPVLTVMIAAGACALLALLVGVPLMRTSTLAIPISTFAFLLVTYVVIANWDRLTGGNAGLVSIPTTTGVESAGAWAAVAVVVALAFKWSASGYRLQATREDEVAARSLGIGVLRERLLALSISAALCGAGGALAVHQSGVLTPSSFYFATTVTTLTMLVVGGSRSVLGAVTGALTVAAVSEVLRTLEEGSRLFGLVSIGETPGLAAIGLGLILLGTMIAMPDGLTGGREAGELRLGSRRRRKPAPAHQASRPSRPSAAGERKDGSLRAQGISVSFAGLVVLRGVDLELRAGEALGLIGPNGAGKTTLVNVVSGFQTPDSGRVSLDGTEITGWAPARLARAGLGRSFQAALPFRRVTALEGVAMGAMGIGLGKRAAVARAAELLERLGLQEEAEVPAGALPPGGQRLLGVARALATLPRYLLLDEPAAGLNEQEGAELVEAIRRVVADFGCGVLVIEHDMSLVAELCETVQVIDDGATVALGSAAEVQADPAVIESYLGSGFLVGSDA